MNNGYSILDPQAPSSARRGSCGLAIMIKAPRAGASKTRLVPPLAPHEAAALSICFLRDTAANIAGISTLRGAEGVAVYTPVGAEAAFDNLLTETFNLLPQRGESFGERLFYAAEDYLIGLKHAHHHLFANIDWSTPRVLSQTIERAAEINLEVDVLPAWYDVDDAATLVHLCDELFSSNGERAVRAGLAGYDAPHTRRYLSRLIERQGRQRIWPDIATRSEVTAE